MRVQIPKEISELAIKISPYMELDIDTHECRLSPNAPKDIVEAHKIFHEWMQEHTKFHIPGI